MDKPAVFTGHVHLKPLPPFDFHLSARIFSGGDKQIRSYGSGKFTQVLRLSNKLALVIISSSGSVDTPELDVDLNSDKKITAQDILKTEEMVTRLFNLRLDLNPFYDEIRNDRTLAKIASLLRGLKSPGTVTVFEALVDSIIEQQISLAVAHAMETRLIKTLGDTLKLNSFNYYAFPTPESIASSTIEKLRSCGLSARKSEYIIGISKSIDEGKLDLEGLREKQKTVDIIEVLDSIRGIGVWTAELTVLRGMQKFDVIPADDLGLRRTISKYNSNGKPITAEETRKIAEKWGKWKGLAAFYLIIANMTGIK